MSDIDDGRGASPAATGAGVDSGATRQDGGALGRVSGRVAAAVWEVGGKVVMTPVPVSGHPSVAAALKRTVVKAWDDSLFGESAQAAFWQTLSLPPLLLGLLGSLGQARAGAHASEVGEWQEDRDERLAGPAGVLTSR